MLWHSFKMRKQYKGKNNTHASYRSNFNIPGFCYIMTHEHELSCNMPVTINYIKSEPTTERYTSRVFFYFRMF